MTTRNFRLIIEFDGTPFSGWQYQPDRLTVEGELRRATALLHSPTAGALRLYGCGRTDAGVSACNYVANVHLDTNLDPDRMVRALNYHLPKEIHVKFGEVVAAHFHARFDATSKLYRYRIVRGHSPVRHARAWELRYPIDAPRMAAALAVFRGRHDFRPFCHTDETTGFCNMMEATLKVEDDELNVAVRADRFLYKMVRRIIGAAVSHGCGRIAVTDIRNALGGKKHRPFRTAPAAGLLLDSVEYGWPPWNCGGH